MTFWRPSTSNSTSRGKQNKYIFIHLMPQKQGKSDINTLSQHSSAINPSHSNHGRSEKIKLNFYFHTALWCLKGFMKAL